MYIMKPKKSESYIIIPKQLDMMGKFIDPYEYRVLISLYNNKNGFNMTDSGLARRIGIDRRTIPKVIRRLAEKNFIILSGDKIQLLNDKELKQVSAELTHQLSLQQTGGVA